ncbi:hypothetical protein IJ076_03520 [Candidatus Saccharibacteria bacterium]|nr:hypothetical protein [Candidatus Saccharibacteria bacterium]
MKVLLINSEVDLLTRYLLAWTERIVEECKIKTNEYCRLNDKRATRENFESILSKRRVDLVLLCGHGSDKAVFGESGPILDVENDNLLDGKMAHALSCRSAKILGRDAVKKGAKAYVGYKEDFVVFLNDNISTFEPLKDKTATLFLNPAFVVPKVLLRGGSADEAVNAAKKEYNRSIKKAMGSDIQSDDDQFLNWLYWDRDNLVALT